MKPERASTHLVQKNKPANILFTIIRLCTQVMQDTLSSVIFSRFMGSFQIMEMVCEKSFPLSGNYGSSLKFSKESRIFATRIS